MSATLRPGGTQFSFTPLIPQQGPGTIVKFRAHITNLSESDNPSWTEHNDIGRADPKVLYSTYSKTINISFQTVAIVKEEHPIWVEALNALSEMTKPIYKPGLGYNGIFCRMIIGKLYDVTGYITNVEKVVPPESPWIKDIPLMFDVTVGFRVLGEKKPDYKNSDKNFKHFNFGQGKYS